MQHFRRGCLVDGLDCFELGAAKSDPEKYDRKIAISNSCEKLSTVPNVLVPNNRQRVVTTVRTIIFFF